MAKEKDNEIQEMNESENSAKNVLNQSQSIIEMAKNENNKVAKATDSTPLLGDGVGDNFKGLPMRELISAPLLAAAESNQQLAYSTLDFFNRIAYEEDGSTTRLLKFDVNMPIEEDGVINTENKQHVEAPFIGLIPTPTLYVDHVDVDFQMEVTDTNTFKSGTNAEASTKASAKFWRVQAEVSGKVTTSRENTRTTNQTAKYQVHVSANQQPQTEGLSKLMDIMAKCVEPVGASK
ncbi:MAG: DUF2589 domain-containing protein [Paludibacteraceae bacterium]|nr:DUF2589 domain-containing protein [Paludibacteraceae bacterium]